MFSRENAEQLRHRLPQMDFHGDPVTDELLENYRDHYGLNLQIDGKDAIHRAGCLQSESFELVCQSFSPPSDKPRGTVFILHGYFDHTGIYGRFIRHCLSLGLAVVIFDLPGHGLSSGKVANIHSFRDYSAALLVCLQEARDQGLMEPWYLLGQSTGGAIIVDAILDRAMNVNFQFANYFLLAPLLMTRNWRRNGLMFYLTRLFVKETPRRFSMNSHDQTFLEFLRQSDQLQSRVITRNWVLAMIDYQKRFRRAAPVHLPMQIIQGTGDGTVDWRYNLPKFEQKFPGSHTVIIEEARHHLVNESDEYRSQVFSAITEILAST